MSSSEDVPDLDFPDLPDHFILDVSSASALLYPVRANSDNDDPYLCDLDSDPTVYLHNDVPDLPGLDAILSRDSSDTSTICSVQSDSNSIATNDTDESIPEVEPGPVFPLAILPKIIERVAGIYYRDGRDDIVYWDGKYLKCEHRKAWSQCSHCQSLDTLVNRRRRQREKYRTENLHQRLRRQERVRKYDQRKQANMNQDDKREHSINQLSRYQRMDPAEKKLLLEAKALKRRDPAYKAKQVGYMRAFRAREKDVDSS